MTSMITALLTVLAVGAARAGQTPSCAPPADWGTSKAFADWRVGRVCVAGADTLSITAVAQADRTRALTLVCDEDGPGGMIMFRNLPITGAVTVALKSGTASPTMQLSASHIGVEPETISMVEFGASAQTKRFLAALADGQGPTFTLVVTPSGKPALEMTISRNGLAAAAKPLRSKCTW